LKCIVVFVSLIIVFSSSGPIISGALNKNSFPKNAVNLEMGKLYTINAMPNETLKVEVSNKTEPLISESLQGVLVGGIIGFFSGIVVPLALSRIDRPILNIDEQTVVYDFNLNRYDANASSQSDRFLGARIRIKNNGRTAAEDCKAFLKVGKEMHRVAWAIPKEDSTVTINADDFEYIDLCAVSKVSEEKWIRIFTTERGYGEDQSKAKRHTGDESKGGIIERAELRVSAKNAKHCTKYLRIMRSPDGDKFVYFEATNN
jgi:hypothetical protein